MRHFTSAIASAILLGACAHVPHNDVVIFATSTKVAFDIAPSATSGGVPTFTLGYKRDEGVWMPLVMNGRDSVAIKGEVNCLGSGNDKRCFAMTGAGKVLLDRCLASRGAVPDACLEAAMSELKYVSSDGDKRDTYSVFASFGGDFGAEGGGKVGINQFFATGIAAQNLSKQPNIARALTAESSDSAAAKTAAEQARASTEIALRAIGAVDGAQAGSAANSTVTAAIACWNSNRTAYRAEAHKQMDTADPSLASALDGDDQILVRNALDLSITSHVLVNSVTKSVCP